AVRALAGRGRHRGRSGDTRLLPACLWRHTPRRSGHRAADALAARPARRRCALLPHRASQTARSACLITRSPDSLMPYFLDGNNLIGRERGSALPSEEDRQALVAELAGRLRRTKATAALFFDGPGERRSC